MVKRKTRRAQIPVRHRAYVGSTPTKSTLGTHQLDSGMGAERPQVGARRKS